MMSFNVINHAFVVLQQPGLPMLNYAVNFLPIRVYINKGFESAKNLLC